MHISVIIPVYNSESTVAFAIESVLRQDYSSKELIIVDGNSSDGTLDVIGRYADDIAVLISEDDSGYADALNKGIKASSGDFVLMLAADDRLLPRAISNFSTTILSETDVWCGSVILKMSYGYLIRKSNPNLEELLNNCALENAATFYRKEIFARFGHFSTDYKCANDREMFLKLYRNNACFQIEPTPITLFEMGGLSMADPGRFAIPEDELISVRYGVDPEIIRGNSRKVKRSLLIQKFIEPIKVFLFKVGMISFVYRLLGKKDRYLTREDMLSLEVPSDWLR